jgi:hypothetical protein
MKFCWPGCENLGKSEGHNINFLTAKEKLVCIFKSNVVILHFLYLCFTEYILKRVIIALQIKANTKFLIEKPF